MDFKHSQYNAKQMLIVDGLEFPGDIDEYLLYYNYMQMYKDLMAKPGYKISLVNLNKFKKVFEYVLIHQSCFLNSVLPPYFAKQITTIWSLITVINMTIIFIRCKDVKKRLHACAYLSEICHKLNEMIEIEQNPKKQMY